MAELLVCLQSQGSTTTVPQQRPKVMGSVALSKQVTDGKSMPETRGTYQAEAINEVKELAWVPQEEQFNIQALLHSMMLSSHKNTKKKGNLFSNVNSKNQSSGTHCTDNASVLFLRPGMQFLGPEKTNSSQQRLLLHLLQLPH